MLIENLKNKNKNKTSLYFLHVYTYVMQDSQEIKHSVSVPKVEYLGFRVGVKWKVFY